MNAKLTRALISLLLSVLILPTGFSKAETVEDIRRDRRARIQRALPMAVQPQTHGSFLGINMTGGVLVDSVIPGSPADIAGLRNGDLILTVDGRPMITPEALKTLISNSSPGTRLSLQIYREGKRQAMLVELGATPDAASAQQPGAAPAQAAPADADVSDDPTYGYTKENPVKLGSPELFEAAAMSKVYLRRLRDLNNQPFRFERIGNVGPGADSHIVDLYRLIDSQGTEHRVYVDMYHPELNPLILKAPKGMKIAP